MAKLQKDIEKIMITRNYRLVDEINNLTGSNLVFKQKYLNNNNELLIIEIRNG